VVKIFNARMTAELSEARILFLIGMRFNNLLAVNKWWPVTTAMPKMLDELYRNPQSGFLWHRAYLSGRVILLQQYWRSFDQLVAYAHDKDSVHFPAWGKFNRRVGSDGSVGIFHETYHVTPGSFECVYNNMPLFGLAAASAHVPATGRLAGAKDRFAGKPGDVTP
jgi:hypothetical protein